MTAVLHRHRKNVQLLLDARADPWKTTPIVSLCDHPWYWFGFLSRHESVNAVQISFIQDSEDTVADLLPNGTQIQPSAGETTHPSFDDTAMTDHAKLLLGNLVQKYYSTRPHLMRGCYTSHRWRRIAGNSGGEERPPGGPGFCIERESSCLHQPGEDTSHEFLEDIIRRIFISFTELHQQWRHQIEHRGSSEFADS